jgi:hypothetical protein
MSLLNRYKRPIVKSAGQPGAPKTPHRQIWLTYLDAACHSRLTLLQIGC